MFCRSLFVLVGILYLSCNVKNPKATIKKSLKIPKWQSESVYRTRTDNTVAKRKSTKDKQRSTKHIYKTKDRVTRTPQPLITMNNHNSMYSLPPWLGWPLWNICVTNDHGYVPLVVSTSRSFPHSRLITGFVTRLTRRLLMFPRNPYHIMYVISFIK
jgi:hypothetical protein